MGNSSEREILVAQSLRDMVEDCEEVEFTQVRHDFSSYQNILAENWRCCLVGRSRGGRRRKSTGVQGGCSIKGVGHKNRGRCDEGTKLDQGIMYQLMMALSSS